MGRKAEGRGGRRGIGMMSANDTNCEEEEACKESVCFRIGFFGPYSARMWSLSISHRVFGHLWSNWQGEVLAIK